MTKNEKKQSLRFYVLLITLLMLGATLFFNIQANKDHPEIVDLKIQVQKGYIDNNANKFGRIVTNMAVQLFKITVEMLPEREANSFLQSGAGKTIILTIYKIGVFLIALPTAILFGMFGILNGMVERTKKYVNFDPPSAFWFHLAYRLPSFTTFVVFCLWVVDAGFLSLFSLLVILCVKFCVFGYILAKNYPFYL